MKKIIKIAALILAMIFIGTCFTSCGDSKEEMANKIHKKMKITISAKYKSYTDEYKTNLLKEFNASEIFNPTGKNISDYGITLNRPSDFQKDYKVEINEEKRKITINLHTQVEALYNQDERRIIEINLPYKVKKTSNGKISSSGKTVIVEYKLENLKTTVLYNGSTQLYNGYAIIDEIIIKY